MVNFQYCTLVAAGGVPIRLADQSGAPYPTTGNGAIVFSNGATLTNVTLNGYVLNAPIGVNSNGSQAAPAIYLLTTDKGFYSNGNGNISVAANNATIASFTSTGGGTFFDFFAGNFTRITMLSDTSNETQIDSVNTANTAAYTLVLNKYGGNVRVGYASGSHNASNGNLSAYGIITSGGTDSVLTAGGSKDYSFQLGNAKVGIYAGTGAPTISGTYGSLYLRSDNAGLVMPYVNTNNGTTWDQLVGANATQTVSNKTFVNTSFSGSPTIDSGTITASSPFLITQTWDNNAVNFEAIKVNITNTASASPSYLLRLQVGGSDKLYIDASGTIVGGAVYSNGNGNFETGTGIPSGGTQDVGVLFSSTAHFGIIFGSGAPTASMAKGTLYIRSDGTGTNDRAYINTDGGTTWTALVTVA